MPSDQLKPSILIVDDAPTNIELLGEALMPDHEIRVVTNGPEAIEIVLSENPPDLILLDVMMPGMDGYQVCRHLKSRERSRHIPVIFVTARGEEEDEAMGFDLGAVDYIRKPFRLSVVKARVKTHLELKRHRDSLEALVSERTAEIRAANAQLTQEIQDRREAQAQLEKTNQVLCNSFVELRKTQEYLIQTEKMAALGALVAGVSHEISTPLGIGVTAASFLAFETRKFAQRQVERGMSVSEMDKYMSIALEAAEILQNNLKRAADLVNSFKQVGADQTNEERRRFNVKQYLQMILFSLQPKFKRHDHAIAVICAEDIEIESYPGVFSQIITNLVINSLQHAFENVAEGRIEIRITATQEGMNLEYADNGNGMAEEDVKKIYEPFFTTKRGRGGTGLGMHIVYNLVTQVLDGQIACKSTPGQGTTFSIVIPLTMETYLCKPLDVN